jgi:hypothetical protein
LPFERVTTLSPRVAKGATTASPASGSVGAFVVCVSPSIQSTVAPTERVAVVVPTSPLKLVSSCHAWIVSDAPRYCALGTAGLNSIGPPLQQNAVPVVHRG